MIKKKDSPSSQALSQNGSISSCLPGSSTISWLSTVICWPAADLCFHPSGPLPFHWWLHRQRSPQSQTMPESFTCHWCHRPQRIGHRHWAKYQPVYSEGATTGHGGERVCVSLHVDTYRRLWLCVQKALEHILWCLFLTFNNKDMPYRSHTFQWVSLSYSKKKESAVCLEKMQCAPKVFQPQCINVHVQVLTEDKHVSF